MGKIIPVPKMHEALMNEEWYSERVSGLISSAEKNPFFKQYLKTGMKEGILSDMASALGKMHDVIVEAAKPKLIGRQIIDVRTTTEPLERFILGKASTAYKGVQSGTIRMGGELYSYSDVEVNTIIKDGVEWSREFAEDAKWNAMNRQLEELGRSVGQKETTFVINLYEAIADGSLAGGDALAAGAAAIDWSKIVALWDAVEGEDFSPDTMFFNTKQISQLFTATEFINSQYLPSGKTQLEQGMVGRALTADLFKSSLLVPAGANDANAYCVDKKVAGVMLIRRDILTEPYEDPKNGVFGIVASERIGAKILKTKAVARMDGIKTTL